MSVMWRRRACRLLGDLHVRPRYLAWSFAAAVFFAVPVHAQTLTVVSGAIDTLVTATALSSGIAVVRQMTASISNCERRGGTRTCSAHISVTAGGSTLSATDLRWGVNAAACTNPVAVSTTPPLASTAFPAVLTVTAINGGASGQASFVLCYVVGWSTAPARYTPTLYFRVVRE
ncbi:hypothetical protein [Gemmatimonas phototrophica]|uniref:Uncharacterized protein n=1 Tax=Gemmatimonas phototrophica TaxID=1379270 RepID=A0A143BJY2_9BACT|nr:hypothetical protein [Gemmatimonas phototrophica]AMW04841.1 hypothetical protein GEMMAAP_08335 [Gemmatimonas phototrophica]